MNFGRQQGRVESMVIIFEGDFYGGPWAEGPWGTCWDYSKHLSLLWFFCFVLIIHGFCCTVTETMEVPQLYKLMSIIYKCWKKHICMYVCSWQAYIHDPVREKFSYNSLQCYSKILHLTCLHACLLITNQHLSYLCINMTGFMRLTVKIPVNFQKKFQKVSKFPDFCNPQCQRFNLWFGIQEHNLWCHAQAVHCLSHVRHKINIVFTFPMLLTSLNDYSSNVHSCVSRLSSAQGPSL